MEQEEGEGDDVQADLHSRHAPLHLLVDDWLGRTNHTAQNMRHIMQTGAPVCMMCRRPLNPSRDERSRGLMLSSSKGK